MKMIVAIIHPSKLSAVKAALYEAKINRFIVSDCFGHSDEHSTIESYRGVEMEIDLKRKIRIQIGVNDDFVDTAVNAILGSAKTGETGAGDGKIFVQPIERTIRISSGEEGKDAIGGESQPF
jgi:nitrogen regulatory protein P-II 2